MILELTNRELVKILEDSVRNGFNIVRIGSIASKTINRMKTTDEQQDLLHRLALMEMGPEFEMTEAEFRELIERLRADLDG